MKSNNTPSRGVDLFGVIKGALKQEFVQFRIGIEVGVRTNSSEKWKIRDNKHRKDLNRMSQIRK